MKNSRFTVQIDLGKGVVINAPFKRKWSLAEWRRMSEHIDNATRHIQTASPSEVERFR